MNTRSLIKLVFSLNKESNQSFWVFDFTVFENFFPDEIVSMCISDNDEFSGMKQFIFLIEKIRNDNIYSLNPDTIFYSLFFFFEKSNFNTFTGYHMWRYQWRSPSTTFISSMIGEYLYRKVVSNCKPLHKRDFRLFFFGGGGGTFLHVEENRVKNDAK